MAHSRHGHDVAVDDVVHVSAVLNVSERLSHADEHADIVHEDANVQPVQSVPQHRVDGLAVSKVRGDRFYHHRTIYSA